MKTKIKEIFESSLVGKKIQVFGWIRSIRKQGQISFIMLNDGSSFAPLQLVLQNHERKEALAIGTSICVTGILQESPGALQKVELIVDELVVLGQCLSGFPLQKKGHSFEYLRTIEHLRGRTSTFQAIFRIRSEISFAVHSFFHQSWFSYMHTPLITGSDAEGAGEMFELFASKQMFFGKSSKLTVSGQLHLETLVGCLGNVYSFGPTFRAESSNTKRHASEFWMIEPEAAFCDLNELIKLAEEFLQYIAIHIKKTCVKELEFCTKFLDENLPSTIEQLVNKSFSRITYSEAISLLEASERKFEFPIHWGCDLKTEHERFLAEEYAKGPIFITDYPKEIKSFYMKASSDKKTVSCMDLLVPKIGELLGGSQREESYEKLKTRITDLGMSLDDYDWYLDLRKYGAIPTSGFGLGLERLVMYLTGMENIRDVIPFPRTTGSLKY